MSNTNEPCIVAVDGPSASGKSTVSRHAAQRLKFMYVDSGAWYRGMTWKAVREGVDVHDPEAVIALMEQSSWDFSVEDRIMSFTIDQVDPSDHLRSEPVREKVSAIAAIPEVRKFIVARLRETSQFGDLVMEGRDIGSVVFPHARFKYYLDADPEERARRRHRELSAKEQDIDVDKVLHSLQRRDQMDSTRKTAPLQIPLGARVINSTSMTVDDVVDLIVHDVESFRNQA
jgi:CMP/dCMP kinase